MQQEVDTILKWADQWKMKVNASKTKSLVIASSSADQSWDPGLKAGTVPIKLERLNRFLGVKDLSDLS